VKTVLILIATALLAACSNNNTAASSEPKKDALGPGAPAAASAASSPEPAPKAYDGPFGLKQGLTLDQVRAVTSLTAGDTLGLYSAASVPAPHVAFESYVLGFSSKSGLCTITAIGKDITAGSYGTEVISAFDDLESALQKKYGPDKKYDFASGLMDDPQYWMMALHDKNRTLAAIWNKESKATLPPSLSSIGMDARGSDINTAYINLRYEFSNVDDCVNEAKQEQNKGL
jgi:hypothetical protein